jgi:hypothetical protein
MTATARMIPLSYLRIWCRRHKAWVSFKTSAGDRYLASGTGYGVELPDGQLSPISPRLNFPRVDGYSVIHLDKLAEYTEPGSGVYFMALPMGEWQLDASFVVPLEELARDPLAGIDWVAKIAPAERYLLVKALANGLMQWSDLDEVGAKRVNGETVGTVLVHHRICLWEPLLACCLGIRTPSQFDIEPLRALVRRRDFELTGEILLALGRINRSQLEYAVQIVRQASQAIGQILSAVNTCGPAVLDRALMHLDTRIKEPGSSVALVGELLVNQHVIGKDDLSELIDKHLVAHQNLADLLVSTHACKRADITRFKSLCPGADFQVEIGEQALSKYLVRGALTTRRHLDHAQRVQRRRRRVLRELLISLGLAATEDIDAVMDPHRPEEHCEVERLGSLLKQRDARPAAVVEQVLHQPRMARHPIGATLAALGACSVADVHLALDMQAGWRREHPHPDLHLGETLVRHGILTREALASPKEQMVHQEKPFGRIPVRNRLWTPEEVIECLNTQDVRRQTRFNDYIRKHIPGQSVISRVASWMRRRAGR